VFEALIGAIYLDKGYTYCEKFIQKRVIIPYVDIARLEGKVISYKSLLIEWCQKEKRLSITTYSKITASPESVFLA
jgi:ribonuclease-3